MVVPVAQENGTSSEDGDGCCGSHHVPVLLQPVLDGLVPGPGKVFCDLTLGGAGHFIEVAGRISPGGIAVGVDRDEQALKRARVKLETVSLERVEIHLVHSGFGEIKGIFSQLGLKTADCVLLDLGLSSDQLDDPERGFSFQHDGRLDMRQDRRQELTAEEVVNGYPVVDLKRILREYGEERYAGRIAEAIGQGRGRRRITTTRELAELVAGVVPGRRGKSHPATRTFQAIRIEVGDELGQIRECLAGVADLLAIGGRLAVITFHSLEDRTVKGSLRPWGRHGGRGDWQVVQRGRTIQPDQDEIRGNPRSRSAKLRVFEKVRVDKGRTG